MHMQIVAIRDRAADAFMQPFFCFSIGTAIRAFQDEINKPDTPLHAHPDDYDLYHIGRFDDQIGLITALDKPEQIAIGKQLVK